MGSSAQMLNIAFLCQCLPSSRWWLLDKIQAAFYLNTVPYAPFLSNWPQHYVTLNSFGLGLAWIGNKRTVG